MYIFIAVINSATPDGEQIQEANTHKNLRGMYSQSVFGTSTTNVINIQGLDYKCI